MNVSFLRNQFERSLCYAILWVWKVFTFINIPNSKLNLFTVYVRMSKKEENKDGLRMAVFVEPAMLYSGRAAAVPHSYNAVQIHPTGASVWNEFYV